MAAGIDLDTTRSMFLAVARRMEASEPYLSELDRAIGDGDHGIGMARGFEAVRGALETRPYESVGKLLQGIGGALMASIGGASGAIFGTWFRAGGAGLAAEPVFTTGGLSRLLADGLAAVKARGGAQAGAKTMIDALEPAAARAAELVDRPLGEALPAVAEAARQGMERTRDMVATTGKAKTLGERSLGHPDPGAASTWLILQAMAEHQAAGVPPAGG